MPRAKVKRYEVRIVVKRNGITVRQGEFKSMTLYRIKQSYRRVEKQLPSSFTFLLETRSKDVVWLGQGLVDSAAQPSEPE